MSDQRREALFQSFSSAQLSNPSVYPRSFTSRLLTPRSLSLTRSYRFQCAIKPSWCWSVRTRESRGATATKNQKLASSRAISAVLFFNVARTWWIRRVPVTYNLKAISYGISKATLHRNTMWLICFCIVVVFHSVISLLSGWTSISS